MNKIVVTYKNADLDCVASAYAYAEYLNKIGILSTYYISGMVQDEVNIVCNLFNISLINKVSKIEDEDIIVVDTNTLSSIDYVKPQNIIEFIDHHPNSGDIKYCENATLKLYDVGAVCTIIAEMFKENNIAISRESAILLYYGIISNTINLKAKITTEKDISMLTWLKKNCEDIDESLIAKIFEQKSKINIEYLRVFMEVEEKFIINNDEMIIGQLEITNAIEFLNKYRNNIDTIISNVYNEYKVEYVFLNIIDILNGYHLIYTPDQKCLSFLENNLDITFKNGIYKEDAIVLRKEIKKHLKDLMANKE